MALSRSSGFLEDESCSNKSQMWRKGKAIILIEGESVEQRKSESASGSTVDAVILYSKGPLYAVHTSSLPTQPVRLLCACHGCLTTQTSANAPARRGACGATLAM